MKKIKQNPLGKSREERETCFPESGRAELHPAEFPSAKGETV